MLWESNCLQVSGATKAAPAVYGEVCPTAPQGEHSVRVCMYACMCLQLSPTQQCTASKLSKRACPAHHTTARPLATPRVDTGPAKRACPNHRNCLSSHTTGVGPAARPVSRQLHVSVCCSAAPDLSTRIKDDMKVCVSVCTHMCVCLWAQTGFFFWTCTGRLWEQGFALVGMYQTP